MENRRYVKKIWAGKHKLAVIVVNPDTNKVLDATYWWTRQDNKITRMSMSLAQRFIDKYPVV